MKRFMSRFGVMLVVLVCSWQTWEANGKPLAKDAAAPVGAVIPAQGDWSIKVLVKGPLFGKAESVRTYWYPNDDDSQKALMERTATLYQRNGTDEITIQIPADPSQSGWSGDFTKGVLRIYLIMPDEKQPLFAARYNVDTTVAATSSQNSVASSPTSTTSVAASPPVGARQPVAVAATVAGAPISIRVDKTSFDGRIISGGSMVAGVIELAPDANGIVQKHITNPSAEPLVLEVPPGSPMQPWLAAAFEGTGTSRNGGVFGGMLTQRGQQLEFYDGTVTRIFLPTLDKASNQPGFFQVTIAPRRTAQSSLNEADLQHAPVGNGLGQWRTNNFRFSMGDLETDHVTRIEAFGVTFDRSGGGNGVDQFLTRAQPGKQTVSNLVLTLDSDTVPRWLAWYDDFVIQGNSGNDREKSFTLDLLGPSRNVVTTLRGSGVGIISLWRLPVPGHATRSRVQVELYVEQLMVTGP